jgi:hypothetical protein
MLLLAAEIQRLESELHHPGVPCSRERLEQLLHPDFHEVGRSGRPYDRETVIRYLAAQLAPPDVQAFGHRLHVLAPDCVLLTFRSHQRAGDGRVTNEALRSSIWRLGDPGWQLYYHQGTPAAVSPTDAARSAA